MPLRSASANPSVRLVEIGWEVCNQLGGIYTVLRSKAPEMVEEWGDRYVLLGPLNRSQAAIEFEEERVGDGFDEAADVLRKQGFEVQVGRWQVSGKPRAVLIGLDALRAHIPEQTERLAEKLEVEIPEEDTLVADVVAFSIGVEWFLSALESVRPEHTVLSHFHEWMAAVALPLMRADGWKGKTIFTTHATLIGRYMAMNEDRFYSRLAEFDADKEAEHYGILAQHLLEKAAAHACDVFTTVSGITGQECRYLLGRRPDEYVPNGLNVKRYLALHELHQLHAEYRSQLHEFTMGYFFPSYSFDLEQTLYFFTSGRFEFRNKGMDLTLEALSALNRRLQESGSRKTVIFLLITNAPVRNLAVHSLEYATMFREFKVIAREVTDEVRKHLIEQLASGGKFDLNELVPEYWQLRIRRAQYAWKRDWLPPIVTHDVVDDAQDPVLNKIRELELFNNAHDKVKVVYHPEFVRSTSPLFGMDYEEMIRGCHLGVFPSAYEPWGYTPLETLAIGIPAISSDLAGFGAYAAEYRRLHQRAGLYVVNRRGKPREESVAQLADMMFQFSQQDRRQRIAQRNRAENFAQHFDWSQLIHHYHDAHLLALQPQEA
ncbi:MAG: glycosyltransferase [Bacteroidetes bacterium]|nr:glycosyltransferase [Bacteroidota bacterium]